MKPLAAADSNGVPIQQDKTPVSVQLTRVALHISPPPTHPPSLPACLPATRSPHLRPRRDMITGSVMGVHRIFDEVGGRRGGRGRNE